MRLVTVPVLACLAAFAPGARAHFHILLPDAHSVKAGKPVTLTCTWGHPFEHQLFDAAAPTRLHVRGPGERTDLTSKVEKVTVPGDKGKKVTAYRVKFTPAKRGDYVFYWKAPPVWLAEEEAFVQDNVKVVLHVQAGKGWDSRVSGRDELELVPLTRPYGLEPGMVFQARLDQPVFKPKTPRAPASGFLVEVERYNPKPPKLLPPEEHITRAVKTDPGGVATTTLTDPGWWSLTATSPAEDTREKDGKKYPLRQRTTLWVYVSPKPAK